MAASLPPGKTRALADHPTSADVNLSEDLVLGILSRLPTAALSRFKRVCKDWRRRLIPMILGRRPNLAFIHVPQSEPRLLCLSHDGQVRQDLCSHSLFDVYKNPWYSYFPHLLLNICNGMTLSRSITYPRRRSIYADPFDAIFSDPDREYAVINPVTGEICIIPGPPPAMSMSPMRSTATVLAFDPRSSSRHFKFVVWKDMVPRSEPKASFLYTSRTNLWRRLEERAPPSRRRPVFGSGDGCYCFDGTAYRITKLRHASVMNVLTVHVCIAVFRVEEESLTWIKSPEAASAGVGEDLRCGYALGESVGGLFYAYRGAKFVWIWTLEDSRSGEWSLRHRVDMEDHVRPRWPSVSFLTFHPEDADVVFLIIAEFLFIFDLKRSKLQEFCKLGGEREWFVYPFFTSRKFERSCPICPSCSSLEKY